MHTRDQRRTHNVRRLLFLFVLIKLSCFVSFRFVVCVCYAQYICIYTYDLHNLYVQNVQTRFGFISSFSFYYIVRFGIHIHSERRHACCYWRRQCRAPTVDDNIVVWLLLWSSLFISFVFWHRTTCELHGVSACY